MNWHLVGSIYGRSSINICSFCPDPLFLIGWFKKKSSLKPLGQMNRNLVGSICGRSSDFPPKPLLQIFGWMDRRPLLLYPSPLSRGDNKYMTLTFGSNYSARPLHILSTPIIKPSVHSSKYLKQGFWGKILVFGWKITNIENCVLFMRQL
jgi:hypothetical protein